MIDSKNKPERLQRKSGFHFFARSRRLLHWRASRPICYGKQDAAIRRTGGFRAAPPKGETAATLPLSQI
ncbi:hypothetical protein B1812_19825 [Methylocystis bryophila]|uniref:Uncharacterized protein n=1 Tax=Methylocystis bryophila TaxID=655015 RepID=A0A1W6MZG7_9HYPH|nr:hypothetical protein B1812_19825 [Methylocystis bryophila]